MTFYGGHKAVARPDPIPNSAVKHRIADGSACIACARVGSRQTFKSRTSKESGFLLYSFNVLPEGSRFVDLHPWTAVTDARFIGSN